MESEKWISASWSYVFRVQSCGRRTTTDWKMDNAMHERCRYKFTHKTIPNLLWLLLFCYSNNGWPSIMGLSRPAWHTSCLVVAIAAHGRSATLIEYIYFSCVKCSLLRLQAHIITNIIIIIIIFVFCVSMRNNGEWVNALWDRLTVCVYVQTVWIVSVCAWVCVYLMLLFFRLLSSFCYALHSLVYCRDLCLRIIEPSAIVLECGCGCDAMAASFIIIKAVNAYHFEECNLLSNMHRLLSLSRTSHTGQTPMKIKHDPHRKWEKITN